MRSLLLAAALATLASAACAAPLERDLGEGLVYRRVHELPGDLPGAASIGAHPCVLDLRFVKGDAVDAAILLGWLRGHAGPKTPVFLLANAATSRHLLEPLDSPDAVNGLLIIGPSFPGFVPDLELAVPAAQDRKAYDALEKGAPIASLLTEEVRKNRVDEEKLDREHLPDSAAAEDDAEPAAPPAPAAPAPPIDVVLRRAVQVHRSLLAMRRI
jgi:hypothetical protein